MSVRAKYKIYSIDFATKPAKEFCIYFQKGLSTKIVKNLCKKKNNDFRKGRLNSDDFIQQ